MAPRGGPRRSEAAEPQAFHQLGVRGRKTGVELIDTGERDEYGMQPLDDLLSSPERGPSRANQQDDDDDDDDQYDDDQGSEDMDIETSAGPGPRTLLKERSIPYPLPRSRSPVKTQLLSPARRNRNLEHLSSPTRRSVAEERDPTVTRKLDFGAKSSGRPRGGANGINGSLPEEEEDEDADETEDADEPEQEEDVSDNMDLLEQSRQLLEAMHGDSVSPEPEPEPEHSEPPSEEDEPPVKQPVAAKKGRGRPPRPKPVQQEPEEEPLEEEPVEEESEEDAAPVPAKKGRKPNKPAPQPKQPKAAPASRKRRAEPEPEPEPEEDDQPEDEVSEPEPEESAPPAKKQRTAPVKPSKPAAKAAASKAPGRPKGRPPRSKAPAEETGETSFAALQRGPPMPKSRGLVSVRHDAEEVRTTRSGRHSFKPLDWWRGDKVVQEEEEFDGVTGRDKFVLTTIKEVIRKPQEEAPVKKAKGRGAKGRPKRAPEVELEDWEHNPGVVNGEVILWEPEHELHPPADDEPVEVMEDRVAIAGNAIQTKDIHDTTFRFAKTLTTPFLGAGIVDLPPGADKRPKNSRKMHMVFFLHSGKVLVTVNEASFRLSAGGMWFVPRGNYYSITNDYDKPARIFFSQGCEVTSQPTEGEQSQMSVMA